MEMLPPAPCDDDDDDQSVTSAAFGIESSATSFTAPRHVLLELDDEGDLQTILDADGGARTATSRFWGVHWNRKSRKWMAHYRDADGKQHYARKAHGHGRPCDHRRRAKRRREEPAATPSTRARHQRRTVNYAEDPDYEP